MYIFTLLNHSKDISIVNVAFTLYFLILKVFKLNFGRPTETYSTKSFSPHVQRAAAFGLDLVRLSF